MSPSITAKRLSRLESLPLELIEKIFLEAREVNFARASLRIARWMSREKVYKIFLLQAYWNDPQDCIRDPYLHWNSAYQDVSLPKYNYADREIVAHTFGAIRYQPLRLMEQERLQRLVASCCWFNLSRFKKVLPLLLTLTLNTVDYQRVLSGWGLIDHWIDMDNLSSTYSATNTAGLLSHDREPRELRILDDFTVEGTYHNAAHGRAHMIRAVRVFHFPSKVLHGPWTDDRLQLLILLRCAFGKRFRWYDEGAWSQRQRALSPSFSIHACFDGMGDAILEKNASALKYLLDIVQTFGPSMSTYRRQIHVPAGVYRLASPWAASHPQLFGLLLQVGSNALPQTRRIFKWASKRIAMGDWLSICAYSYLRTQRLRIYDVLCTMLSLRCRSREKPRAAQRILLPGLARGSALDGEPIF